MNLFPRTPYQRLPSMPKVGMPKIPKISMGMPKMSSGTAKMPGITQPKTPVAPSLKSVNTANLVGPTASQKGSAAMFKSAQPAKMAIVKGAVSKIKLK